MFEAVRDQLTQIGIIQRLFKYLKSVNVFPEYESNLNHLSYERWRHHFLLVRLQLAFLVGICIYFSAIFINFLRFFLWKEPFFDQNLYLQIFASLGLLICLRLLKTSWGDQHLSWLFLGLGISLQLSKQIIQTVHGNVKPDLFGWVLTFVSQATLIPVRLMWHFTSQLIILGYYFGINKLFHHKIIPSSSDSLMLLLFLFWTCLICNLSVYLYENLQRTWFNSRQKLEEAYEQLAVTEAKYRSIFENSLEGLFQSTPDGRFISANPALARIYGYSSPEDLMQNLSSIPDQIYVSPERREEFVYLMNQQGTVLEFESQVYRCDGSIIWISENARVIRDSTGKIIAYEGDVKDITQRKYSEAEIKKALDQEKELNQLKSRFVSMISHEFRTPLTTILASAEALEYYGHKWDEEKKLNYLQRIQTTVHHLTELLNQVLIIGQGEAQKIPFQPSLINLENFCYSIIQEMQIGIKYKQRLHFIPPKNQVLDTSQLPTQVYLDERLLRHILYNLISNAIKYSPQEGNIELNLNYNQNQVILTLKDEGIGIPQEDQQHLFEPFHRAKNVGVIPGTGLGLTIVKKSVEIQGGIIQVQSKINSGTIVTVIFPLSTGENE
ncbi:MAG TPA: PAS domain-containing sensor histidine kinase [Candidatus Obscuribacterales bacterium]